MSERPYNSTQGVFDPAAPGYFRQIDPVQQAVDDYLLMERKARAWDELRAFVAGPGHAPGILAQMDALVHPAQDRSTR